MNKNQLRKLREVIVAIKLETILGELHGAEKRLLDAKLDRDIAKRKRDKAIAAIRKSCEHKESVCSFSPNYLMDIPTYIVCVCCGQRMKHDPNKRTKGSRCIRYDKYRRIVKEVDRRLGLGDEEE